jgi:leader peptidase (prepilin peptidase)/N-methyltransferase
MEFLHTLAASPGLFIGCCVALGLLVGSFLNVVIYRVPIMMDNELRAECDELLNRSAENGLAEAPAEAAADAHHDEPVEAAATEAAKEVPAAGMGDPASPLPTGATPEAVVEVEVEATHSEPSAFNLVVPRSACPNCKAPITALQNVPVVSWLVLRGKCANCKTPISMRYPAVELATGALSGFIAWHFGYGGLALAALAFTWLLIALTMIDFDTQYLPDQLTYPLLWLGLIMSLWQPAWGGGADSVGPADSIIGAVAGYLSLWSVYWAFKLLTGKEGMGYGDFKLFAALGAWLGWKMLLPIIVLASGVGAIFGVILMIRQRKGKDMQLAFGPFLAIAGWLALVAGHSFMARYFPFFVVG